MSSPPSPPPSRCAQRKPRVAPVRASVDPGDPDTRVRSEPFLHSRRSEGEGKTSRLDGKKKSRRPIRRAPPRVPPAFPTDPLVPPSLPRPQALRLENERLKNELDAPVPPSPSPRAGRARPRRRPSRRRRRPAPPRPRSRRPLLPPRRRRAPPPPSRGGGAPLPPRRA